MKIIKYTIDDLKEELGSNGLWNRNVLPITRQRVLSYINNPNACGNDPVLFIAYNKDDIIGYIGVLPDKIFINDVEHDMAWASSWWVDTYFRNAGIGGLLLLTVLNHFDLITSSSTDSAEKVFRASKKLALLREEPGMEYIVRCCSSFLIIRNFSKLKRFQPFLKSIDRLVNLFVDLRLYFWKCSNAGMKPQSIEIISEIDAETEDFIKKNRMGDLSARTAKELNWIIRNPWIISSPIADRNVPRYYFSSISGRFFYLNIKVFDANNTMAGFIMFKIRNNSMAIPYLYFERSALTSILYLIGFLIIELNIDIFITYNMDIINNLARIKLPCLFRKDLVRYYHLSNAFKDMEIDKVRIQDGDGDCVFT